MLHLLCTYLQPELLIRIPHSWNNSFLVFDKRYQPHTSKTDSLSIKWNIIIHKGKSSFREASVLSIYPEAKSARLVFHAVIHLDSVDQSYDIFMGYLVSRFNFYAKKVGTSVWEQKPAH